MSQTWVFGKVDRGRAGFAQIRLFPSRLNVRTSWRVIQNILSTNRHSPEIFDEYTRRQYKAKAPTRNPFGEEEIPAKFADFDAFTKIRVLYQLSQWTLINSDRIREKMPETKDTEQTQWVYDLLSR